MLRAIAAHAGHLENFGAGFALAAELSSVRFLEHGCRRCDGCCRVRRARWTSRFLHHAEGWDPHLHPRWCWGLPRQARRRQWSVDQHVIGDAHRWMAGASCIASDLGRDLQDAAIEAFALVQSFGEAESRPAARPVSRPLSRSSRGSSMHGRPYLQQPRQLGVTLPDRGCTWASPLPRPRAKTGTRRRGLDRNSGPAPVCKRLRVTVRTTVVVVRGWPIIEA